MSKKVRTLIFVVATITFLASATKIIWTYYQMHVGQSAYDNISQEVITEPPVETVEVPDNPWPTIDFATLDSINPDIIAWLFIPDTPISYPIMRGPDNNAYLRTTFDKKPNILGSIFQDYRNDADFADQNTVIYGHNTRNDTMFGSLKKYKQLEYAEQRTNIYVIRKSDVLVYEIFAVYETLATSDTYTIRFESDASFASYLQEMAAKTVTQVGSPPDSGHIITLSTCTGGDQTMRLVLQAKLVETVPSGT
ncbi:MAG: class B sortase [Clostridiales bacterium]|nr:class B sortase [Clostridiales bacterium]